MNDYSMRSQHLYNKFNENRRDQLSPSDSLDSLGKTVRVSSFLMRQSRKLLESRSDGFVVRRER